MKSWLYRELNASAKAWPYYRNDRVKQRSSIKSSLRTIQSALNTKDAYVTIGKGDTALHYQDQARNETGTHIFGNGTLSGFGCREARMYQRLGIPLIDMSDADYHRLAEAVIRGPLVAYGTREPDAPREDGRYGSLAYAPLEYVAGLYYNAGCVVHNMPANTQWGA